MTTGALLFATCITDGEDDKIVAFRMDQQTGALTREGGGGSELAMPLFVAAHPENKAIYIADFVKECSGVPGGAIAAYGVDGDSGALTYLGRKPAMGSVPCYVSLSHDARFALVANYGDGSVSVLPVDENGALGDAVAHVKHEPSTVGEEEGCGRNAHSFVFSPDGHYAFAADLGLDAILAYRFDGETGSITPHDPAYLRTAKKAGPRHLAWHPNHRFLFAMTEYDNTVISMSYDAAKGTLASVDVQPALPADFDGQSFGSDIHVHASGKFLYVANRGHESITAFAIDQTHGKLTLIGCTPTQGEFPRGFTLDPAGRFLLVANEKSDCIVTFAIDQKTGELTEAGSTMQITKPSALRFV